MWTYICNFYNSHKYVILWTVAYFIITWTVMRFMFNFDILSAHRWWQLMHAHLHGFPGFVFGILILAAVPMYIATTIVIARTKAPLFTITIPEFIKKAFIQTPMQEENEPEDIDETANTTEQTTKTPETSPIPETVPNEIRVAYARAREHIGRTPTSVFDLGNVTTSTSVDTEPKQEQQPEPEIPIPTDFDIDDLDDITNSVPKFTEINFDDDDEDNDDETEDDTIFQENSGVQELSETISPVVEYMKSKSIDFMIKDDVVITDKYAIASHTDDDFWVADETAWFAAGKTRPSPIEIVKLFASNNNVQPVLYLGAKNIMDIDNLVPQWESNGIRVVTNLDDLLQ